MRSILVLCVLGLSGAAGVHAKQPTEPPLPQLKAGMWQSQNQLWIDGRDVVAELKQQQQGFIGFLPKAQQAKVQQMVQQRDPSRVRQCVPSSQLHQLKTPQDYLRVVQQRLPKCQLQVTKRQGSHVYFSGQCQGQHGYTGSVAGQVTFIGSTQLQLQAQGQGRAMVPGYSDGRSSQQFRVVSQAQWLGQSCSA